jgi:uncharacterized protein with HEPN domain
MKILTECIKIAQIHVIRINYARLKLVSYFPISVELLEQITEEELPILELYTSRFAKLQDLLGNKIFTLFLEQMGKNVEQMSLIDKINELKKLAIIDNAYDWQSMREIRNHLTHEYPDQPEITAKYLNIMHTLTPALVQCLEKIKERIRS